MRTATVVGGGPAGLMAAEILADAGLAVTVYEHKRSMGRKFLLAGRGGLNITHTEDMEAFLARYGDEHARGRLAETIAMFGPDDVREWCAQLGEPTFVGTSGRVFPESFKATPLLRAWLRRLDAAGVEFRSGFQWQRFAGECSQLFSATDGTILADTDVTIMALGGASWPRIGADGGWTDAFADAGISVSPFSPANCGVQLPWTNIFRDRFHGTPLKNVALSVDAHPVDGSGLGATVRGDCVVTRRGLEGGPVYAHSAALREAITRGEGVLWVDLLPDLTTEQLVARLAKRRPKESASTWLRKAGLGPLQVGLLRELTNNKLPERPSRMASLIKSGRFDVDELMPIDRAISSAGGVELAELDDNYMVRSRPGLFLAGEMLDWDAPTGGYLLQACLSTGVAAARGALEWLSA